MKKRKRIGLLLFAFLAVASLTSCGGPRAVSVEVLQNDLSLHPQFVNSVNMEDTTISDLKVVKRQTTAEDKTDRVWVQVDVENDDTKGQLYYFMIYGLYNDGWMLDNVEIDSRDEWRFTPLQGPAEDMLNRYLPSDAVISDENLNLEAGTMDMKYTYIESFNCCDVSYEKELKFVFSPYSGLWSVDEQNEISKTEHWNVDGNWYYEKTDDDSGIGIALYLLNFDPANMDTVEGGFAIKSWNKYLLSGAWDDGVPVYGPFAIEEVPESENSNYKYLICTNKERPIHFSSEYYIKISYDNIAVGGKGSTESYWVLHRDN